MTMTPTYWRLCSTCKAEIGFQKIYFTCSVSTCNQKRTDLAFCSVSCWDAHLPLAKHREASAIEKRSPSLAQWQHQKDEERRVDDQPSPPVQARQSKTPNSPSAPGMPTVVQMREVSQPHDILVVVSKLKKYIYERSGMNTSDSVMKVLSDHLRTICDEGVRNAAKAGRKTVMDRDFKSFLI